jgi:hypothetical protein
MKRPSKRSLGLNRQNVLIQYKRTCFLFNERQGLKSEAQELVFESESRECFLEANIDS